ncbi:MAG: 16S rRNA (adenine(1518)-N(6)/adenine(1519)-N(6))-dimethyltransferase RsmA [Pseudomonadota bacterium]
MTAIDGLPPLREVIQKHGLGAKKSLGQNFLLDLNLTSRIARSAGSLEGYDIIEVGPGPGGLTRALLACGAERVIAVERDNRCIEALEEIASHYPGKLEIIEGDALQTNWEELVSRKARIVANLPYNIATPLLTGWLGGEGWPPFFTSLTLMFQKEVAERICAQPGDKQYGRLGVLCGWRTIAQKAFDVSPKAFTPPPKVTSSIVHLEPVENPLECNLKHLEKVTKAAFGQRRKMLRASLKPLGGEDLLQKAGIDPTKRAEEISIEAFVRLANLI